MLNQQEKDKLWVTALDELNEVQRRRFAAIKAIELGWGGISKVCKLMGMSNHTVEKGINELKNSKKNDVGVRLRKKGGGRKKITNKNPKIKERIEEILDENTAGDPISSLKWTNKSTYAIADKLTSENYDISKDSVGRIIHELNYSLQANKKSKESGSTQERDSQFRYINKEVKRCMSRDIPVISVDAKKKELIGNFKNSGRTWKKKGHAEVVNIYDFESLGKGKAIPYGILDFAKNKGFVNVGVSGNTSEFAVESIRSWWKHIGHQNYPNTKELFICADGGGSNSSKSRPWKYYLYEFAKEQGLKIVMCHYPPGTSKWNKIEHRMLSFISMNWKGKPLRTYEIVLNLIQNTTTKIGLRIAAKMDKRIYELHKKVTDEEFEKILIKPHQTNPNWNYTLN